MANSYVGVKYFREVNEELEVLRVLVDSNENEFKCAVESSDKRLRISKDSLLNNYTRLRPDGVIHFNIVDVGDIEDVMIMMYRHKDIEEHKVTPYIICRQNITDIFANVIKPDYNNLITGLAVSEDSLPEKISMDTILACDGVKKTVSVSVYIDDTLDIILSMIKSKPFDIVLYNLFAEHIRYKYKDKVREYMNKDVVDGYSKSLVNLLKDNEFMYEFYRGFGIYPVSFDVTDTEKDAQALNLWHSSLMSTVIMRKIQKTFLIPFDKSFDLDKIERDYFLIMDLYNKLYIVAYTWDGLMEIPVADIESKENIQKLASIPGYSNNESVLNALRFNTNKYKD